MLLALFPHTLIAAKYSSVHLCLYSLVIITPLTMPHSDHSSSPHCGFFDLPPFPDNIPTAPLLRISLEKLLQHDPEEEQRCWKACCDLGFFYLDLNSSSPISNTANSTLRDGDVKLRGENLLQDADQLFEVMKGFYELDVQEKVKYDFKDQGSYFGYKGYGEGFIDKQGTRDRNEFYNVGARVGCQEPHVNLQNSDLQRRYPRNKLTTPFARCSESVPRSL